MEFLDDKDICPWNEESLVNSVIDTNITHLIQERDPRTASSYWPVPLGQSTDSPTLWNSDKAYNRSENRR